MDEDGIALVLAKSSELRSKIINSIAESSNAEEQARGFESGKAESTSAGNREDNNEEETEGLLNIKYAIESLEGQLLSLQSLQQQQWNEHESALAEIECSRNKLLEELREYKGKELEVIREAIAFASEQRTTTNFYFLHIPADLLILLPQTWLSPIFPSHA